MGLKPENIRELLSFIAKSPKPPTVGQIKKYMELPFEEALAGL